MTPTPILILPGIENSGPAHWQSRWEHIHAQDAGLRLQRIHQQQWDAPECENWVASLEAHVQDMGTGIILVAHSLACLMVVKWAALSALSSHIRGALLVAVPDPLGAAFPSQARNFDQLPQRKLPFACVQLASANDPFSSLEFSRKISRAWGSQLHELGTMGHMNASSGLGDWDAGWAYVRQLLDATGSSMH